MVSTPKLSFQVSPLWLTGPPIGATPVPIIAFTDPTLFLQAVQGQASTTQTVQTQAQTSSASQSLDDAFGAFQVLPGGSLVKQEVAQYPFANQWIAGNATIFQPLELSLIWDTPMRGGNAWATRLSNITNLQARLTYHNNSGGTFTIVTPSFIYTNMIMTGMTDASRPQNPVPQNAWRFDFIKPLIMLSDAAAAQSALMAKLTAGVTTDGSWSGVQAGQGLPTQMPQFLMPNPTVLATGLVSGAGGTQIT
jgi:hypothetical protein